MIIPQAHDEDHTIGEGLGHVGCSTLLLVSVSVPEDSLLRIAELGCDGVTRDASNGRVGLSDSLSVLNVEALDFHSVASADELRDDSKLLGCINSLSLAIEVLDAHAVGVEVTAIGIARPGVPIGRVCSTAAVAIATGLRNCGTRVRCHRCADGVRFPNIHLSAARAVATNSSVSIIGGWLPTFDIGLGIVLAYTLGWSDHAFTYFTINELQVTWTLGIAITRSVFSASLVGRVLRKTAVCVHSDEVQRTIQTAGQVR